MTDVRQLHRKWSKRAAYRKAHAALQDEFDLASQLIAARARAGMSQADVARKMKTTQSAVARLESGKLGPSPRTLERFARATGSRLVIRLEPAA